MRARTAIILFVCVLLAGCAAVPATGGRPYRAPGEYNMKFTARTAGIADPARDRRCYYRVFIDREEAGRTSTGLESQTVSFEAKLSVNRHLIEVEKWVLNARDGSYVKLNRIDQPRPGFFYFDVVDGRISIVTMVIDAGSGRSVYALEHERD